MILGHKGSTKIGRIHGFFFKQKYEAALQAVDDNIGVHSRALPAVVKITRHIFEYIQNDRVSR